MNGVANTGFPGLFIEHDVCNDSPACVCTAYCWKSKLNKTRFYSTNYSYRWVVVIPICKILFIVLIKFCMGLVMLLLIYFNQ